MSSMPRQHSMSTLTQKVLRTLLHLIFRLEDFSRMEALEELSQPAYKQLYLATKFDRYGSQKRTIKVRETW